MKTLRKLFARLGRHSRPEPIMPPEPILGRCLVPTGPDCAQEIHLHGGAKFRRVSPDSNANPEPKKLP